MKIELLNLDEKLTIKDLAAKLNELIEAYNELPAPRDRGPKSERQMTDDDARSILAGELMHASHKKAAEELGLSYGQIYSCRGGYTFKHIHKELEQQEA